MRGRCSASPGAFRPHIGNQCRRWLGGCAAWVPGPRWTPERTPTRWPGWIAETEAEKASYALEASKPELRRRLTEQEIKGIVDKFADVARVLIDADPRRQG